VTYSDIHQNSFGLLSVVISHWIYYKSSLPSNHNITLNVYFIIKLVWITLILKQVNKSSSPFISQIYKNCIFLFHVYIYNPRYWLFTFKNITVIVFVSSDDRIFLYLNNLKAWFMTSLLRTSLFMMSCAGFVVEPGAIIVKYQKHIVYI